MAVLTVITFWHRQDCGFANFDDDMYNNASVQSGLNWPSIQQAFSPELVEQSGCRFNLLMQYFKQ